MDTRPESMKAIKRDIKQNPERQTLGEGRLTHGSVGCEISVAWRGQEGLVREE